MISPKLFPIALIILDLGAAIAYACVHDWRRAVYWTAAAALTSAITF